MKTSSAETYAFVARERRPAALVVRSGYTIFDWRVLRSRHEAIRDAESCAETGMAGALIVQEHSRGLPPLTWTIEWTISGPAEIPKGM
jgi:hypothetical protein